jgi:hypothetical protein
MATFERLRPMATWEGATECYGLALRLELTMRPHKAATLWLAQPDNLITQPQPKLVKLHDLWFRHAERSRTGADVKALQCPADCQG